MPKEIDYKYYCDDCHVFVDEHHRCEQWKTVHRIPVEALEPCEKENKKLRDALEELGNILYEDFSGIGNLETARDIIKESLEESE